MQHFRHIYRLPSGILFKQRDFKLRRCEFDHVVI